MTTAPTPYIRPDIRWVSALVFGVAGMLLPALWFLPIASHVRDPATAILYVGLPGVSAAIAAAIGAPLLDPGRCRNAGRAALSGTAIALASILIFAPLFAVGIKWTEPGWHNVLGLAMLTVFFSVIAIGWAVALVGAVAGWIVWARVSRPVRPAS